MFLPSAELDSEQQNEDGHFQTLFFKSSSRTCQKDGETTLVASLRTDSVERILDSSNCHCPDRNISVKLDWREGLPLSPNPNLSGKALVTRQWTLKQEKPVEEKRKLEIRCERATT